jgi:CRISPR-associated protein Cmr6
MSSRRQSLGNVSFANTHHAGLWLDKFLVTAEDVVLAGGEKPKAALVEQASRLNQPAQYPAVFNRWKAQLFEMGVPLYEATVQGRLAIGLGGASAIETAVSIHRTYGVPYIPGSALKGTAAHYAHQYLGEEWRKNSQAHFAHATLFGTTNSAGYVTFLDALPVPDRWKLHPDTITVHHPDYYQGTNQAPADWDSPTPVPFLSVSGTFLIALHAPDAPEWAKKGIEILHNALIEIGVGAKTSSGYGRMSIELPSPSPEEQLVSHLQMQLSQLRHQDVPAQIHSLYQEWKKLETQPQQLAEAILEKIKSHSKYFKKAREKQWVQELIACLPLDKQANYQ